MIPAITPITIPAIAPGLKPPPPDRVAIGSVLPLAVAGARKGMVVVADRVDVKVEAPPLVGRKGRTPEEIELVTVGAGWSVYVHKVVAVACIPTSVHDPHCIHL